MLGDERGTGETDDYNDGLVVFMVRGKEAGSYRRTFKEMECGSLTGSCDAYL